MTKNFTAKEVRAAANGGQMMRLLLTGDEMSGYGQPCPVCGGDDRFRYVRNTDSFFCSHLDSRNGSGYGDWFEFLVHREGNFKSALQIAVQMAGLDDGYDYSELRERVKKDAAKRAKLKHEKELRRYYESEILDEMFNIEELIKLRQREIDPEPVEKVAVIELIKKLESYYGIG